MTADSAQGWIAIIVALGTALAAVVAQWRSGSKIAAIAQVASNSLDVSSTTDQKTDVVIEEIGKVHTLTNNNYREQQMLNQAQDKAISILTKQLEVANLLLQKNEDTRANLASKTAEGNTAAAIAAASLPVVETEQVIIKP